jgi:hypothetical protein
VSNDEEGISEEAASGDEDVEGIVEGFDCLMAEEEREKEED